MELASLTRTQRRRLAVAGIVQGVGFRPFVHGLAARHGLAGHVRNAGGLVEIEVEGDAAALEAFGAALVVEAPAVARIDAVGATALRARGEARFHIAPSADGCACGGIPPDLATCPDCVR